MLNAHPAPVKKMEKLESMKGILPWEKQTAHKSGYLLQKLLLKKGRTTMLEAICAVVFTVFMGVSNYVLVKAKYEMDHNNTEWQ